MNLKPVAAIIFMTIALSGLAHATSKEEHEKEAARLAAEQGEVNRRIQNIYAAKDKINLLIEHVCQSLKITSFLTNSNLCRAAAQSYLEGHEIPSDNGYRLKYFMLELSETMCSSKFVDESAKDSFWGEKYRKQDPLVQSEFNCWDTVVDGHNMNLIERIGDGCKRLEATPEGVQCRINIVEDVKNTTATQIFVDDLVRKQAAEEAAKVK